MFEFNPSAKFSPSTPLVSHRPAALSLRGLANAVTLLLFACSSSPVLADNVVTGGNFNNPSDVVAWDEGFGQREIEWDARDVQLSASSGSLRLTSQDPSGDSGYIVARLCVLVTPGLNYRFSASTLIPAGQARTTRVKVFAKYNFTSHCDPGSFLNTTGTNEVLVTGSWQDLFIGDTVAPETAHSVQIVLGSRKLQDGGSVDVLFDNVTLEEITGNCVSAPDTLCLNDNRFSVKVEWLTPADEAGVGTAVPMTLDSGLFWFFEPSNLEVLIKVLDACSFTPHYWVFFAATTDVNYRLTVTDTDTGGIRQYINPQGNLAQAVADTSAFPCP